MQVQLSFAERLAVATTALGVLHHVDHVLRVDHSGWPFRPEVTPFTYSLLVYVLIAGLFLTRAWPRFRIALAGVLAAVPTLAHVFLETPVDQYLTWAARPDINLLAVSSPAMGVIAVVITILLSLFALAVFVALVRSRGI